MSSALKIKKVKGYGRPKTTLWAEDKTFKECSDLDCIHEVCEYLQYLRLYPDQEFWTSKQKEQHKRFKRVIEILESCFSGCN